MNRQRTLYGDHGDEHPFGKGFPDGQRQGSSRTFGTAGAIVATGTTDDINAIGTICADGGLMARTPTPVELQGTGGERRGSGRAKRGAVRVLRALLLLGCANTSLVHGVEAQVEVRNLVVSMGSTGSVYRGNLPSVNVFVTDSAERAIAASAELGARGALMLLERPNRTASLSFNGDVRQTAALGFLTRDFAPTEWSGGTAAVYNQQSGGMLLSATIGIEGRSIRDRPPMPLFMQPGYRKTAAAALVTYPTSEASSVDVQLRVQDADYGAPPNFAQLNLLDRRDVGLEVGGSRRSDDAMLRFYMRLDASEYASQKSFELLDPFRRDRTYRAGFSWQREGDVFFRGNLEAIANRSNSKRPEYNTVRAEAHVQLPLSRGYSVQVLAILANKSYIHDTQFLRLVPGEEADNRSEVWLGISRQVAEGLDARLQLEWARAETDLSDAYFRSYGLSIALEYRPSW